MCLGADVIRGKNQKPFDEKLQYDYLLWIDSDIIFRPEHLIQLLSHNDDIVSGIYMMADNKHFATVKNWDEEYFKQHGSFQFLTPQDIPNNSVQKSFADKPETVNRQPFPLLEVAYTGMGFMLVKRGVFESMEYPWFRPIEIQIGNMTDFTMEDVSFCLRAQEKGYKIYIDPTVRVGHEKKVVI
jgi:GT2 family glycosyltransferase